MILSARALPLLLPRNAEVAVTFALALVLRLVVAPLINHPWDAQTWWNVFTDLSSGNDFLDSLRKPYETMRELSFMARAEQKGVYYEYWAYPPGMLYLFYPLAKIYSALNGGLVYHVSGPYSFAVADVPLSFSFLVKAPNLLADLAIGRFIYHVAGRSAARAYLFNPYVILASAWMFDTVMVLCILLAIYFTKKEQPIAGGLLLGFGAAIKYVPLFILPAFAIYLWWRPQRTLAQLVLFLGTFFAVFAVLCWPVKDGMSYVMAFHNQRFGGGLSWQTIFYTLATNFPQRDWERYMLVYLGAIGGITLPIGLVWTSVYMYFRSLSIYQYTLVGLLGYLAFTKLVNEIYLLPVFVLAIIVTSERKTPTRVFFTRLFWCIPFAWAMINVPLQAFLVQFAQQLGWLTAEEIKALYELHRLNFRPLSIILGVGGVLCTLMYLAAIHVFTRGERMTSTALAPPVLATPTIRFRWKRVGQICSIGLFVAALGVTLGWLLYSNAQLAKRVGHLTQQQHWEIFMLEDRGVRLRFEKQAGAGRPFIYSAEDNLQLLEYSDWDGSSKILVERTGLGGASEKLNDHPHSYAADFERNRLNHAMRGNGWELIKDVRITGERTVQVDFYFIARTADIRLVRLTLGHYHWYFQNLKRLEDGFVAEVNNLTKKEIEEGLSAPSSWEVRLQTLVPLAPVLEPVYIALPETWGVANVATTYQIRSPSQDERILIASEKVTWRKPMT